MKIGILTFWWGSDNYGQILQAFALQKYLKSQGHDAYLVRYKPKAVGLRAKLKRVLSVSTLWSYLKSRKSAKRSSEFQRAHPRYFSEFVRTRFTLSPRTYSSLDDLRKNPPEADAYGVGSDQVWNKSVGLNNFGRAWFLDFGSDTVRRFSYAASFGMKNLPEDYRRFFSPLLRRFDAISVREAEGVEFSTHMGRPDASLVCDPTLLLSKDDYCSLISDMSDKSDGKSLVCYMLGHACDFPKESINAFIRENNLELHYVPSQGAESRDYYSEIETPTIEGWLQLYRDAEYVVTNSFHGTVFAILMQKKFLVLPLSGRSGAMNGRLATLLASVGLSDRLLKNRDDFSGILRREIDWRGVSLEISKIREKGFSFLGDVLK